jgi:2-polyprenyl-3-methyl-5-hydroxy-6-metoxy-1,4-benzoquinol methylase
MKNKNKNKNSFYKVLEHNIIKDRNVLNEKFGIDSAWKWNNDPRQFFISQARYKFVSKILSGKKNVLEVGCSDAFNSRIVLQEVKKLSVCDIDENLLYNADQIKNKKWFYHIFKHDFVFSPLKKKYDAIFFLDVLEHIPINKEKIFLKNICLTLKKNGANIVGLPSLEFQKHSRSVNISGHINCKTGEQLKNFLSSFFDNVFVFSMNDEIVHTGFQKMACYLFAVCTNLK